MIRLQFFKPDQCDKANKFLEEHGARGTNGVNLGPAGIYITYEDGVFSKSVQLDILNGQLIKNKTSWLTQNITFQTLTRKKESTEKRLGEIEDEMKKLTGELKESSVEYKKIKPELDKLKAERDYLKNIIMPNIGNEYLTTKGDMDRLDYETEQIAIMIKDLK